MATFSLRRPGGLLLAIGGFLIVAIVLTGHAHYRRQRAEAMTAARDALAAIANLKVAQISQWRAERLTDAQFLRRTPYAARRALDVLRQPDAGTTRDMLVGWLDSLAVGGQFEQVLLCDTQLNVRLTYPLGSTGVLGPIGRRAAEAARTNLQVTVTDLHRDGPNAPVHFGFVVPLVVRGTNSREGVPPAGTPATSTDRAGGLLVLKIDAERRLYPMLQTWPTPSRSGEILLLEEEGPNVVFLNALRHQSNAALRLRLPISSFKLDNPALSSLSNRVVELLDYRGVPSLAAVRALRGTPWILVAKMDLEEVHAPLRQQARLTALAAGVSILAALLGMGLVWRQQQLTTERQRREAERHFRVLFDQAGVGVARVNSRTGQFQQINQHYCNLLGYHVQELLHTHSHSLTHPDDLPTEHAQMQRLLAGEIRGFSLDKRCFRKDGAVLWITLTVSPTWMPGEPPASHIAVAQDISERKRLEAARDRTIADLRSALANNKTLAGLLPICAGCKKIRDQGDRWQDLETYLETRTGAHFTHGLCPDCTRRYYPELEPEPEPEPQTSRTSHP